MNVTSESSPASSVVHRSFPAYAVFVLVGLVWLPALIRYSYEWAVNPQYYYGWAVPLLAAYLIYDRWPGRPVPQKPSHPRWALAVVILFALPQLPLRLVGEANSSARLISLGMAIVAIGVSAGLLYLAGGRGWFRYFMGPVCFLLVAMPWPGQIEKPLVQGLMRINAQIAAETVSFAGVPAEARGNVIEIPTGVLGVNEACSGIRSLQSTLMAACFLGALYRCTPLGFGLLVFSGVAIAFVCNVVRTVFLTWQGAFHGVEATEKWHDSAGFAILGVVLVCLWLISQFLERQALKKDPPATGAAA